MRARSAWVKGDARRKHMRAHTPRCHMPDRWGLAHAIQAPLARASGALAAALGQQAKGVPFPIWILHGKCVYVR
eukprot:8496152-Pyramimonas_sp.AAC.1